MATKKKRGDEDEPPAEEPLEASAEEPLEDEAPPEGPPLIRGMRFADISELAPDPENANTHPERSIEEISKSLESLGAGRSILIDGRNLVVAGNGVLEAAANAGFDRVLIVPTDGHTLVAVQRPDLSPEQAAEMGIRDNRSAQFAVMNLDRLVAAAEKSTRSLADLGYRDSEFKALQKLAERAAAAAASEETGEDPGEGRYQEQFGVVVLCEGEEDQRAVFEALRGQFPEREVKVVTT
jgi:hypothetical protein